MIKVLNEPNVFEKIKSIQSAVDEVFQGRGELVPDSPARDVEHLMPLDMPSKPGFGSLSGQHRLIHDLASIELQAMELGLRSLIEFPDAPHGFKEELALLTLSEASHLEMLLTELDNHGGFWGMFPVHTGLWSATSIEDSLLDRITIVHRHLEGSGLDAGSQILHRLDSLKIPRIKSALQTINREEIGHVEFGSRWYREICRSTGIDPDQDFSERILKLGRKLPLRAEKINRELRKLAGFTEGELDFLEMRRQSWLDSKDQKIK